MSRDRNATDAAAPLGDIQGPIDPEQAVPTSIASRILGLDEVTLQQRRAKGLEPRFFRIGRTIRYRLGDVLAFRDARMVGKAP
jgi:hypothetical protein